MLPHTPGTPEQHALIRWGPKSSRGGGGGLFVLMKKKRNTGTFTHLPLKRTIILIMLLGQCFLVLLLLSILFLSINKGTIKKIKKQVVPELSQCH